MAMSKLEAIMDIFIAAGKQDLPVAIIQHGTTPDEKMAIGKVNDIVFRAQFEGLSNPAIIIIGEVVNHRQDYHHMLAVAQLVEHKQNPDIQ